MLDRIKIIEGSQPVESGRYQGKAIKDLQGKINEIIAEYKDDYEVVNVEISYMPIMRYQGEIHHYVVVAILKMRKIKKRG